MAPEPDGSKRSIFFGILVYIPKKDTRPYAVCLCSSTKSLLYNLAYVDLALRCRLGQSTFRAVKTRLLPERNLGHLVYSNQNNYPASHLERNLGTRRTENRE